MNHQAKLDQVRSSYSARISSAVTPKDLDAAFESYLGKKSDLSKLLSSLKSLDATERGKVGAEANKLKQEITAAYAKQKRKLADAAYAKRLETETMDVTIPGETSELGSLHPLTQEMEKVANIFISMGFKPYDPYMVDSDFYNFESVNMPPGHPARDMWDTFHTSDGNLLITHTSSMQNRIMKDNEPPIRAFALGKCFRHEATDARHEASFFQLEGVYVDKGIKFSDMLGTLQVFLSEYFKTEAKIKVRPSYFPFVEPGAEIAMQCPVCKGAKTPGCEGCGGHGWMELLGCGMIHPNVIKMAGLDPEVYSGFAWGMGIDRLVMMKYQLDDIRNFHSGRLDFLKQFAQI